MMFGVGKLLLFLLILFQSLQAFAAVPLDELDVKISIHIDGNNIVTTILNNPYHATLLPLGKGVDDFDFWFWNMDGRVMPRCAIGFYLDYPRRFVRLDPSKTLTSSFKLEELGRFFCLPPGKYFVQATFPSELSDKFFSERVSSNPIIIDMGREL